MSKHQNIRKRKDGRWEARVRIPDNGEKKNKYKSLYGKSYTDVKNKMENYRSEIGVIDLRSEQPATAMFTFGDLIKKWRKSIRTKIKGSTEIKYDYLIEKHIIPRLGNIPIGKLNTDLLTEYIADKLLKGRLDGCGGLSASYVRTIAIIINSAINFGCNEGLCNIRKIKSVIPSSGSCSPEAMTKSEQTTLEKHLFYEKNGTNAAVLLSLRTGMRIGEICSLEWSNINFEEKYISVRKTVVRKKLVNHQIGFTIDTPKTVTSVRDIPITDELVAYLKCIRAHNNSAYVISEKERFMLPSTLEYRFHRLLKKVGIKDTNFHTLRHTFATRCIESGIDEKSLSELLGHSNVSITLNTYVHSSMELKKSHMENLSQMLRIGG